MGNPDSPDDLYELAPEDPPRPTHPVTARPVAARPGGSAPMNAQPTGAAGQVRPLEYRTPADESAAAVDPDTLRDLWMPLWLLAAGVLIEVIAAWVRSPTLKVALATIGIGVILQPVIMLIGILIAARVRGIRLGNLWTAMFKLAAVSIAPAAVLTLASPIVRLLPFGWVLGWIAQFILYFALLGVLFDLDESDTWYCVAVIFIVGLVFRFSVMGALLWLN